MRIKNQKDFWAGLMFIAFGAFFAGFGTQYTIGTAAKMGPGYFPISLGILLMILGAIVSVMGMRPKATDEKIEKFDWYANGWVLGAVVLFGILLPKGGLIVALIGLICMSSYASHEFKVKATIANTAVLIAACYVIFVWGLKLQFSLLPTFLAK